MVIWTDDPVRDAEMYFAEQEAELNRLPRCSECDEPIQSEICFEFNDELICPDCLSRNHRKWVDDYI